MRLVSAMPTTNRLESAVHCFDGEFNQFLEEDGFGFSFAVLLLQLNNLFLFLFKVPRLNPQKYDGEKKETKNVLWNPTVN